MRTILHIKHALSLKPSVALAYLVERFKMLRKYLGLLKPVEPKVFKTHDIVDHSATIVRAIEARAQPVFDAWESYIPTFYPGRITLIRAELREHRPGVIDDDPEMGWGRFTDQGVDIANLPCGHTEMLDTRQSQVLAKLLKERLPGSSTVMTNSAPLRARKPV